MLNDSITKKLTAPLNTSMVSTRKGGSGQSLQYLEGHRVIDQANEIFGFGGWGYRTLSCEMRNIDDPSTGECLGVMYEATVEVRVVGGEPIVDVGSATVATPFISDLSGKSPIVARRIIMESHENTRKGAVTDGLKRCLRVFGSQFGNDLYGTGSSAPVVVKEEPRKATPDQLESIRKGFAMIGELLEETQEETLKKTREALHTAVDFESANRLKQELRARYKEVSEQKKKAEAEQAKEVGDTPITEEQKKSIRGGMRQVYVAEGKSKEDARVDAEATLASVTTSKAATEVIETLRVRLKDAQAKKSERVNGTLSSNQGFNLMK
jgi:DNA recombination protein Rad52